MVKPADMTQRLLGAVVEVAWVASHIATYPSGIGVERHQTDLHSSQVPVLLVHGLADNRSIFAVLRRMLHRNGVRRVMAMNYSPLTADVRAAATVLATRIEAICAETGSPRIHVVGHSLGGLIARYYVQRMGGDARVQTLITLGTPHGGTARARLLPFNSLARQLLPGSEILAELAEPAPGCRTRFVAVYSRHDPVVTPARCARIDHDDLDVRNVPISGVGHVSLTCHPWVVDLVCAELGGQVRGRGLDRAQAGIRGSAAMAA